MKFARGHRWLRRFLWPLAAVVWIVIITLPALGLLLAVRSELSWQPGEHLAYRVWVIMEQEERGLGWEVRRAASRSMVVLPIPGRPSSKIPAPDITKSSTISIVP